MAAEGGRIAETKKPAGAEEKRVYRSPVFKMYGAIRELTASGSRFPGRKEQVWATSSRWTRPGWDVMRSRDGRSLAVYRFADTAIASDVALPELSRLEGAARRIVFRLFPPSDTPSL